MPDRKYSVAEIDRMRIAVASMRHRLMGSDTVTEDRLRTYMLNGTDPEELEEAAKAFVESEPNQMHRFSERFRPKRTCTDFSIY